MGTILVVDDEPMILSLVEQCLARDGHEIFTATSGARAMSIARRVNPHLIILDIEMPAMSGLDVCRQLREDPTLCRTLVLFLTKLDAVEDRVQGLDVGGDDYLPKPFSLDELSARVRALLRRAVPSEEQEAGKVLRAGDLVLDTAGREATVRGQCVSLTPVQFDLLAYLMVNAQRVVSADELLQRVWGYAPGTGDGSLVRWHIRNLRQKIEREPAAPEFIKTVPGHGYMLTPSS